MQRAGNAAISMNNLQLNFVRKENGQPLASSTFAKDDSGMQLISFLNQRDACEQGKYYNLYRDNAGTQPITYAELSCNLGQLNLTADANVFVAKEDEPRF